MKIIAVDDEYWSLQGIISAVKKLDRGLYIKGFCDWEEALNDARKEKPDVAFLDIEMRDQNGVNLAKRLKVLNPYINIIFTTGYKEYMEDAFDLHASGYILKPVTSDKVRKELDNLRYPPKRPRVRIQTFGNFEIFVDKIPVTFQYSRTKELLAILVDKRGSMCTKGMIMSLLWWDEGDHSSYMRNLLADLNRALKERNCGDIILKNRGQIGIDIRKIACDYYEWLEGKPEAIRAFNGEYMSQYSWAENTLASMLASEADTRTLL